MDSKPPKKTKIHIVDESMRVFTQTETPIKDLPYQVQCQTRFGDRFNDIDRFRPAIIAYQCISEYGLDDEELFQRALKRIRNEEGCSQDTDEDPAVEEKIEVMVESIPERQKEEMAFISNLINFVKSLENYIPILVFFRCYFQTSKALQESFQYPMLVTHADSISLDVCLNLAGIYDTKQSEKMDAMIKAKVQQLKKQDPNKYRRLTESDFEEKKFFIKKSNSLSFGSIKLPVILSTISESEIFFKTEIELPMKTYRLDFPLNLSIHLVPVEDGKDFLDDKGLKTYRGVIHSISEGDKMTLRQQVNEIFFEPLKEQRKKEADEFKELNEKVQQEREEQLKEEEERAKEALGMNEDGEEQSSDGENIEKPEGETSEPDEENKPE